MPSNPALRGAAVARALGAALCAALLGTGTSPLQAQVAQRDPSIDNLPRPGYEPRAIHLGSATIQPTFDADLTYDDNIFATPGSHRGDAIFDLKPRIALDRADPTLTINANVHGDFIRYARTPRENVNTFGTELDATKSFGLRQSLRADVAFDRTFQRRSDPEADVDALRPPALINLLTGDLRYQYQGARIGITADASLTKLDYLPVEDAEKDLLTYRFSVRGSVAVTSRIAAYVEPFYERRDARLPVDNSGVDRDNRTTGALAGLSFDIASKLQGNMGVGAFRSNPDDPTLKSFTGLAASGRLSWRPRVRTSIVLDVFRGDVATIRTGATGRIDTRVGLSVSQEVRHNLLLDVGAGIRNIHYRGTIDRNQRFKTLDAQLRYLLNRHWTAFIDGNYTHRGADAREDRFNRLRTMIGIRYAY